MQNLKTNANIAKPDDLYERLIRAHDGLTKEQSDALNARLILILLNHIGDEAVIHEALVLAKSLIEESSLVKVPEPIQKPR